MVWRPGGTSVYLLDDIDVQSSAKREGLLARDSFEYDLTSTSPLESALSLKSVIAIDMVDIVLCVRGA